ncbi:MAG: CHRD domain-containing protein [Terrimonas sp.]|nr:CHRD domain-containing protein [Terrimonas sp.]
MRLTKLTALFSSLCLFFLISSCDRDTNLDNSNVSRAKGLQMSSSQEVPGNSSMGTGSIDATYDKGSKTLTYSFSWSGLNGPAVAANVHGPASRGTVALPPPLGRYTNGIAQTLWSPSAAKGTAGSYSGSLFVDGVVIKEADILAGKMYINIVTPANPTGEIRGQIEF